MPGPDAARVRRCFKSYDVRGRIGADLDDVVIARVAGSFADVTGARSVVLGHDNRPSSAGFAAAAAQAFTQAGCEVTDLGLCGTEEVYSATSHFAAGGGMCITASHNPLSDNGVKFVGAGSAPLPADVFATMRERAATVGGGWARGAGRLLNRGVEARSAYVQRVLSFMDVQRLRPLRILVNAGHGAAGPTFDAIAAQLREMGAPLTFVRMNHEPDGRFPRGVPNPLLPENRHDTADAVRACEADFGVAWDGDFDRCFFFDHTGTFINGEYAVGLLAGHFLARDPGAAVVHDPRVVWNSQDIVKSLGGRAVQSRTGHVTIKQAMRETCAIYGGEMSAHHYFRDFHACDSGMIPWLVMAEIISAHGPLASLVRERRAAFPSSGEINVVVGDVAAALARVRAAVAGQAHCDDTDGLSADFGDWRFNLRPSNTEALLRLNVEARGRPALVARGVEMIRPLLV